MNYFSRAIKNVTRNKGKSLLLILTFFLIGNLVIIGLGVSNAADQAKILTRMKMRAVATVNVDYKKVDQYINSLDDQDAIDEFYNNYPRVTYEDIKTLLTDSRVKTANATTMNQFYFPSDTPLDYVHLGNSAEENLENMYQFDGGTEERYRYIPPVASCKSNYFPSMIEIEEGEFTVVKGNFYTQVDIDNANAVILVTEEFAALNGLDIGDTIKLSFASKSDTIYYDAGLTEEDLCADFEIIGIYSHIGHITPDSDNFDYAEPYENPDNMMLCPGTTYNHVTMPMRQKMWEYYMSEYPDDEYYNDPANYPSEDNYKQIGIYNCTLLLNDPLDVDDFVAENENSVGEFITVSANNDEFKRLAKPLDTLGLYANFIVTLVVINAIVIISLVTALTLKNRQYEIGVLLSIGASKLKVIIQFFIELALVAIIGFTLAIGSGSLIANKVGATVLDYQIQSSDLDEDEYDYYNYVSIWDDDYSTDISLDDIVSEYNVSVSPLIIGEIYVLGLGIVLVSIIIPSMMIMRYNPKRILMNQY